MVRRGAVVCAVLALESCGSTAPREPSPRHAEGQTARAINRRPTSCPALPAEVAPIDATELESARRGSAEFGIDLYTRVAPDISGGFVIAPASVWTALTMVMPGACGETFVRLANALHATPHPWASAAAMWTPLRSPELHFANRIFLAQGFEVFPEVDRLLVTHYAASVGPLSLAGVNAWVEKETAGRIPNLLPEGAITPDTRMVLVNALHFKARWRTPFDEKRTTPEPFQLDPAQSANVPTMRGVTGAFMTEDNRARVVRLRYASFARDDGGSPREEEYGLVLVVPKGANDVAGVEQALRPGDVRAWLIARENAEIDVSLPRFELKFNADVKPVLKQMGVPDGPYEGMALKPLAIDRVQHGAWLRADELGTEAAGATAVGMSFIKGMTGPRPPPIRVVVDRPFLIFLGEKKSGTLLFAGRVTDPRQQT